MKLRIAMQVLRKSIVALAIAWSVAAGERPAHAQFTTTWTGGAASGDWSTAGNWNNGAPSTSGTWALTFGNTTQTSSTNTVGSASDTVTLSSLTITSNTAVALSRADSRTLTLVNSGSIFIGGTNGIVHTSSIPLTLLGSSTVGGIGSRVLQWNAAISGTGSLELTGGTLLLGNGVTNTFSGGVAMTGGQVDIAGNSAFGAGSLTIGGGALQARFGSRTVTNSGSITGDFAFVNSNPLTLSGSFSLAGNSRTVTVASGSNVFTMSGVLSNGGITKAGAGQLTLSGANTYTGNTAVSAGVLATSAGDRIADSSNIVMTGGTLQFGGGDTVGSLSGTAGTIDIGGFRLTSSLITSATFSGALVGNRLAAAGQGSSGFQKSGSGTLTLAGNVSLAVDSSIAQGSVNPLTVSGGELVLAGTTTLTHVENRINGTGAVVRIASGSHTFNSGTSPVGSVSIQNGSFVLDGGAAAVRGMSIGFSSVAGATNVLTVNGGTLSSPSGFITLGNNTGVTQTPTLNLNGGVLETNGIANGGSGSNSITFNGGTLRMLGASMIPSGTNAGGNVLALNIGNGGAILDTGTHANTISQSLAGVGTGGLTKLGTAQLNLSGTNTYTGPTVITSGTLRASAAAGGQAFGNLSAVSVADAAGTVLDLNGFSQTIGSLAGGGGTGGAVALGAGTLTTGGNNASTSFAGVIGGSGGLTKTGTGVFTLSGANTYTGPTTVAAGVLATSTSNRIAASNIIMAGGTLQFGGSDTVGGLSGTAGTIDIAGFRLDSSLTTSATFSGALVGNRLAAAGQGSSGFQKSGSGTLTLAGNVSLAVDSSIAQGSVNPLTVSGGELVLAGTTTLTNVENRINGSGAVLRITGGSQFFNTGTASPVGSVNVVNGSFIVDGGVAAVRGMSIGFGASAGATNVVTINGGTLTSAAGFIQIGNNNLATQTPTLNLNGGVLETGIMGNGGSGTSTFVFNGGTLRPLAGGAIFTTATNAGGNLLVTKVGNGGALIDTGTLTTTMGLAMVADGSGGLTKLGAGSLALAAANTFTGASTITAGTLQIGTGTTTGSLNPSSAISGGVGTTLAFSRADTIAQGVDFGTIGGAVNVAQVGLGAVVFDRANTYTGSTTISGGTLALGAGGSFAGTPTIVVGDAASIGAVLDLTAKQAFGIEANQRLSGGGTVLLAASGTLAVLGEFSPGNSPGLFTYDGGTTLLSGTTFMEVLGTGRATTPSQGSGFYDAVNVAGNGTLQFGGLLKLEFSQEFIDNTTFDLFLPAAGSALAGNFTGIVVDGGFYTGLTWTESAGVWTSSTTTNNQSLEFTAATGQLVVVPEPSALLLAALGMAVAGWVRSRRCP